MLFCFGVSWPISIIKSIRTRNVSGKSRLFLTIIIVGYLSGIIHKILYSNDLVIFLYIFNLIMVSTDLFLCFYFRNKQAAAV